MARSVTGGENGLQGVPRELFGLDLSDPFYFYYAALPIVLVGLFARLADRALAVRPGAGGDPGQPGPGAGARLPGGAVQAAGLRAVRRRWPGSPAGCSRSATGSPRCRRCYWTTSGKVVIMVVLGGIGTLWGAVIGAALLVLLED